MADEMVRSTQAWLNKTYGGVSGFGTVTEDGITGWGTVYGLIRGLQHELGITGLVNNFGPGTASAFDAIASQIKEGYTAKPNIVYIIQGGFWCKGINPGGFDGKFTSSLSSAIVTMKTEAGLSDRTASLNSTFMAALLNMSAFTLLPSGDPTVQAMQQWLNGQYSNALGILPCDGIYQRDTNTALIYALQIAIGISPSVANGNFGDATTTALKGKSVTVGDSGQLVKLVQYGLYLNGYKNITADGNFTNTTANTVMEFRKFMEYPNQSLGVADFTVIKGLVTSNGDTGRHSSTFDCATQLTAANVAALKANGFSTVGRYLTGSVGTGASRRNKNLTVTEINAILDGGMTFFPIYEDGGYEEDYFNAAQGSKDALIAISTSQDLGLPTGTTIYFAVDVDFQEGDIAGTVIPYINAIQSVMNGSAYTPGIYGTRNVCLHAQEAGIGSSFVANMSYGWSGNLGFRMPTNWTYDQFVEFTSAGVDIDQDAQSSRATSVKAIADTSEQAQIANLADSYLSLFPGISAAFGKINWTVAGPELHQSTLLADYYVSLKADWTATAFSVNEGTMSVEDGKIVTDIQSGLEKVTGALGKYAENDYQGTFNKLAPMVGTGNIKAGPAVRNGMLGMKITIEGTIKRTKNNAIVESKYSLTIEVYYHNDVLPPATTPVFVPVDTNVKIQLPHVDIAPVLVVAGIILGAGIVTASIMSGAPALALLLGTAA